MSLPSTVADDWANTVAPANPSSVNGGQKKPRHRHAPEQLAALNELFEKDEHPPLDVRSALAERLGMETKTVNAWFQNKRASSKKRTRTTGGDRSNGSQLNNGPASSPESAAAPVATAAAPAPSVVPPTSTPSQVTPLHLINEDEYLSSHIQHPVPSKLSYTDIIQGSGLSTFVANPDFSGVSSGRNSPDNMPKKMRMRPTTDQTEELKKLYNTNPHPTAEERQALADRIGMRYQSITNWFQNQRSLAKRRKEDGDGGMESNSSTGDDSYTVNNGGGSGSGGDMSRQYSAFPPPPPHSMHPSLMTPFPNPNGVTSKPPSASRGRRSASPSSDASPRRAARRSVTPYSSAMPTRPRRSRPEPYQLDALKVLFTRTSTPTIEERSALALEIGMDVGKVTNWFRNLRQTARKRSSRLSDGDQEGTNSGLDEELDGLDADDMSPFSSTSNSNRESRSASISRNGTPPRSSSEASSSNLDSKMMDVDVDRRPRDPPQSAMPSDDEDYPKTRTPARRPSHSPPPPAVTSPAAPSGPKPFEGRELPAPRSMRDERYPSLPPHPPAPHPQSYLPTYNYPQPPPPPSHYQGPPPHLSSGVHPPHAPPPSSQLYAHHRVEMPDKPSIPPLLSKEMPPFHARETHAYPHSLSRPLSRQTPAPAPTASADIAFGRFSASVSIFDSSYHPPAGKGYYANEDPVSCAAAAKRCGINLEDAYLLLDFHRQ